MVVIVFLLSIGMFSTVRASEYFSSTQRDGARDFIRICFERLEHIQGTKRREFQQESERAGYYADKLLAQKQIDYKKYSFLEKQREMYLTDMLEAEEYEKSLSRPKEKISEWQEVRESEARALQAYIELSDEWKQYKKDPLNQKYYQILHQHMKAMAHMIVATQGKRAFVGGTHARPSEPDDTVNYDVDRVFFLTLYLLNTQLQAEKASVASSSSSAQ